MDPVSADAWSELLHAEVGTLLGLAGIPCLHIKGPTVATWLYEPGERPWGDVDILVPPDRMDDALATLVDAGLALIHPGLRWQTSEDHAVTLWHDPSQTERGGGADVDVHHRFEGIDANPQRAFAELWRRREPATLAHLDVWFPDLHSRALLLALNAARDPGSGRARDDLQRLLAEGSDDDWALTIALASRLDALEALRAGLELDPAGRDLVARTSLEDVTVSAARRLRVQGATQTARRLEQFGRLRGRARLRAVATWVAPSPAIIVMRDPSAAQSRWHLARGYYRRTREGVLGLRRSVAQVREVRGSR